MNRKLDRKSTKVVTFGEIMFKLSPSSYQRIRQSSTMNVEYAGSEANVAVSLSNFGIETGFVSKLPHNELGAAAANRLRQFGVDVSGIARGGERIGVYIVEKGASQRPSKVIYDRAHSAIAEAEKLDFDWNNIFQDVTWFHFSGITPSLSDTLAEICLDACKAAKGRNITISCDLNYRKKLWTSDKAKLIMTELCKYVDVCIANEEDAANVFGIEAKDTDVNGGALDVESYVAVATKLQTLFGFKLVAITLRESLSASDNNWSAILYDGEQIYKSRKYGIHIVDRIGGGDSFDAGLIYGSLQGFDKQKALDFAVAASCLKQTIEGDFNLVSVSEVENLMLSTGSGRIVR